MNVIVIAHNPSTVLFLKEAFRKIEVYAEIFWVSSYDEIQNNLANTEDIDMIFLDSRFFTSISFKLIEQCMEAGFGDEKSKSLIAMGNRDDTASLMQAGCSDETDFSFFDFSLLMQTLRAEKVS